jgi:hypothetical protein
VELATEELEALHYGTERLRDLAESGYVTKRLPSREDKPLAIVVDDQGLALKVGARNLEGAGFRVEGFLATGLPDYTLDRVREYCAENSPDVAVVDSQYLPAAFPGDYRDQVAGAVRESCAAACLLWSATIESDGVPGWAHGAVEKADGCRLVTEAIRATGRVVVSFDALAWDAALREHRAAPIELPRFRWTTAVGRVP